MYRSTYLSPLVLATTIGLTSLSSPVEAQCDTGIVSTVPQISSTYKAALSTDGQYLFVLGNEQSNEALTVHDLSDPANPVIVKRYSSGGVNNSGLPSGSLFDVKDLAVVGDVLFIVSGCGQPNIEVDVSDPLNAAFKISTLPSSCSGGIDLDGTTLYTTPAQLSIADVSDPSNPVHLGRTGNGWHDVVGAGDYAYTVGSTGAYTVGLYSYRVDDPTQPVLLNTVNYPTLNTCGNYCLSSAANRVEAHANAVYVANPSATYVFDVTDPANPVRVLDLPGGESIEIVNDVLFTGSLSEGVRWYDLSNPLAPAPIGDVLFPQPSGTPAARGLAIGDEYIYAVGPGWITVLGHCLTSDSPPVASAGSDLSVDEGQAFAMLDGSGSSDPDDDTLSFAWAQTAGTTVVLSDPSAAQPTFTAPLVGIGGETLSFELTVTANGEVATDSVDVLVNNLNQTPTVVITSPAEGDVTGATTIAVTADVVDEDGTAITSTPAGITPGTLAAGGGAVSGSLALDLEGSNDLIVSVLDDGGLTAATSIVVYRDTVAPAITISPAEGTIVSSPIPSFGITVNDQTETSVSIDGNPAGTATVPDGDVYGVASALLTGSIPLWTEGANSIAVSATDAAGNTTTITRTVVLDSTAPLVAIATPLNGACYGIGTNVDIPLSATINDATATEVSGALNASLPAGGGTAAGVFTLVEGVNDITVMAQDNAGAGLTASDTVSVTLDTIAPAVAITAPGDFDCVRGTIEFHATASDVLPGSIASTTFFVDGVALAPAGLYSVDTTTLTDGPHQLSVEATDSCGNVSTASITIDVDNTAPAVTLSNPIDLELVSGTIDFDALATDGGSGLAAITMTAANLPPTVDGSSTYAVPVGSGSASSQVDTIAALGGADGLLELDVTAIDCAGNAATVAITVNVDNTAPGKAILQPADGAIVRCSIRITADASDPNLDTVQFVVDGVAQPVLNVAPFEMTYDTRERLDGDLPITLIATDFAGNVSTCTINVTVDNLKVRIMPRSLKLKSRGGAHSVLAKITGQSADLLTDLDPADVTLCVPGGSPIPATKIFGFQSGWRCQDEGQGWHRGHRRWHKHGCYGPESKTFVKFDRKLLIGALRGAGITKGKVELTVKATVGGQTFEIGSSKIRVK